MRLDRSSVVGLLAALVLTGGAAGGFDTRPAQAEEVATILVYYDLDNDSIRDAGEPGVPGQALSSGSGAVTNARGRAQVELAATGRVRLSTGWYRSDCAAPSCDGPTGFDDRHNDFHVRNQFIRLEDAEAGRAYQVGLVPDWPGDYDDMPATFQWDDDGDDVLEAREATGPVNDVDVATRLSWGSPTESACNRTGDRTDRACRPGDEPRIQFQVMNEGASRLARVRGILELPFHSPITTTPSTRPMNQPGLDLEVGDFDPVAGGYPWTLAGVLDIGAVAQFTVQPTVPDVVRASATPASRDHVAVNRITHVRQWDGANDVDSAQCTTGPARACRPTVGSHDKQGSPVDDSDDVGFSVVEVAAGNDLGDTHDLALVLTPATIEPVPAGDRISLDVEVINQGSRPVRNPTVMVHVPAGLSHSAADNPAWTSSATTVLQGQLAAGASTSASLVLRVDQDAEWSMNGTSALRSLSEVVTVYDAGSGTEVPLDVDSTPDDDPSNDGYDVSDPWSPVGDGVVTADGGTVGTSAGGEDDQDPADVIVDGAPECVGSRSEATTTLDFAGDLGETANLRRDGEWFAIVTGATTWVDQEAPADATYVLRTRHAERVVDTDCPVG